MGKIIILDENTANKIAAGEVVERPASVVKELVENSLDAGAASIAVEIRNGGISYIKVMDNGSGMEEDDVGIAFERHSTSKIKYADDIENITSMGFRGEALASIASVSSVQLTTRTRDKSHGTSVEIQGGTIIDIKPSGCPVGTTIIVRDLFYNTPARFKFLKKDTTEAGYISDVISRLALGNPNVSFKLTSNGSAILHTPGNNDPLSSIFSIYGKDTAKDVYEINFEDGKIKVSGYIGKPEIARSTRNHQSLFLNRRYIRSKIVTSALDEAYSTFLMKSKYPFSVINLEVNPVLVDVNVHPSKMEVKFSSEQEIFKAVYHAVSNALLAKSGIREVNPAQKLKSPFVFGKTSLNEVEYKQQSLSYEKPASGTESFIVRETSNVPAFSGIKKSDSVNKALTEKPAANKQSMLPGNEEGLASDKKIDIKENINFKSIFPDKASLKAEEEDKGKNADNNADNNKVASLIKDENYNNFELQIKQEPQIIPKHQNSVRHPETKVDINDEECTEADSQSKKEMERLTDARIIGQVFNTYILLQLQDQLILVDQHAAHERVVYEELKERIKSKNPVSQTLLAGQVVELTGREIEFLNTEKELMQSLGFDYEPFGSNSVILRAAPLSESGNSREIFLRVMDNFLSGDKADRKLSSDEAIYNIACKAAVKANKKLDELEINALVKSLSLLENPYTCPHGRPSAIKISKYELEKMFKRIV